jgi:DNA (cytosine-5)-methyltransferase 1
VAKTRKRASALSVIDLFAGCGGMTAGFAAEGFESKLAVEWDEAAAATFAANFGDHVFCGDIADLAQTLIPEVDVVIGGPPCQGFSNLGMRNAADPRNTLWQQYVRVVLAAKPKVFVIENVDRFLTSGEFTLLQAMVDDGPLNDYEIRFGVLNAADFGVPQRRRRTIVIGSRIGAIELPAPTHAKNGANGLERWATVRETFEGIPLQTATTEMPQSRTTFTDIVGTEITKPGIFKEPDLHFGRRPTQLSLARYDCVPPGGGRFDLPDELLPRCWRDKPTGTTDVLGRMRWDAPSLTVRTEFFKPEKGQYLHPQWEAKRPRQRVNRVISHREAARLQTFPSHFMWCGSKIEIAKQIGNAVPSRLAAAIAAHIRPVIEAFG